MTTTEDTLTPAQAREALTAAGRDKAEAEELAAALADKVRDGDLDVTPKKLAEARQLAEFADLRIEAGRRKLAAAEDADRQARAAQLASDARQLAAEDDQGPLADAIRQVAEVVNTLVDVAQARNGRIGSINHRIRDLDYEFEQAGSSGELAVRHGAARHPEGVIVTGHSMVTRLSAAELVAAAVRLSTGQDKLTEAFSGPDGTLGRVMKAMPALAEQWRHSPDEWAQMDRKQQAHAVSTRRAPAGVKAPEPAVPSHLVPREDR